MLVYLVHMNGRAYDYNLGRFLSVHPMIQAPGNSQSMNPYSYIMNNPLAGTDPSGYVSCDAAGIGDTCNVGDISMDQVGNIEIHQDGSAVVNTTDGKSFKVEGNNGTSNNTNNNLGDLNQGVESLGSQAQRSDGQSTQRQNYNSNSNVNGIPCNDCRGYGLSDFSDDSKIGDIISPDRAEATLWANALGYETPEEANAAARDLQENIRVAVDENVPERSTVRAIATNASDTLTTAAAAGCVTCGIASGLITIGLVADNLIHKEYKEALVTALPSALGKSLKVAGRNLPARERGKR